MKVFVQYVISGIGTGAIYALIAMGFSIVYKGTKSINFAQGEYVAVSGILASEFVAHGLALWLAAIIVIIIGVGMGLLTELIAIRFLRRPDPLTITIGTVGISLVVDSTMIYLTKGSTYSLPYFSKSLAVQLPGGAYLSTQTIWNVGIALVAMVVVGWFYRSTRRGTALRAASDDATMASSFGVSKGSATMWVFGLGGGLAAIAGIAITPVTLMASTQATQISVIGFAAAMLGGLNSLSGAVLGGLLLGISQSLIGGYVSATYVTTWAFLILIAVLLLRPSGLIGSRVVERV